MIIIFFKLVEMLILICPKHIKPYEVFRNVSRDVIASNAPTTLAELKKLNCLDKKTFDLYGEDIVRIVNRVIR